MKQLSFAFFLTRGISLEKWDSLGMLQREIRLYRHTAPLFKTLYIFSYGGSKEVAYQTLFPNNVVIVPKPPLIPVLLYSFFLPFIHRHILKHVHFLKTNQMDGSWAAVIAKKWYGGKLIVRCGYEWLQFIEQGNGSFIKRMVAWCAERFAYKNADTIIVTSMDAKIFINQRFAVPKERIMVIPNFVDTDFFAPNNMAKNEKQIIFVGRLENQKNLFALFEALIGLDVQLLVVGSGSYKESLQAFAKEHELSVVFRGNVPQKEIVDELNKSSVFVLPSFYEGHPKTLLEAMACALPCVGADVSGIRDSIKHLETGILCGTDAVSIHYAVEMLLKDRSLRERVGAAAREHVLSVYSFNTIVEQEISVYTGLQ